MPDDREPLHLGEVVTAIRQVGACAIVHLATHQEVHLYTDVYNKREPWRVRTLFSDVPEKGVLRASLALGFRLSSIESTRSAPTYELSRNCFGDTAAAIKAIELMRLLPEVKAEDWLWVTASEYDDREVPAPDPPANWPPRREPGA
jgi:hypothetical protein